MNPAFWHRKRVLVTGGSGFVGRWLCRALAPAEVELHILDLLRPHNFDLAYTYHQTDLRDLPAVEALLQQVKPDVIMHLAGQPGVESSHNNPLGAYESNVLSTFNLLEACRRHGKVQALLAVSSNHVYGDQPVEPTPEDAPLNGTAMYAVSKVCSDVLARAYGKTYGLPVAIARMTNSFGGDDHHVTHIVTGSILSVLKGERPIIKNSGRDVKSYLYIKDTVDGLLTVTESAVLRPESRGEAYNLMADAPVSVAELVEAIFAAAGSNLKADIRRPDAHFERESLDSTKTRSELGWKPRYTLSAGLAEAIAWYRQHA